MIPLPGSGCFHLFQQIVLIVKSLSSELGAWLCHQDPQCDWSGALGGRAAAHQSGLSHRSDIEAGGEEHLYYRSQWVCEGDPQEFLLLLLLKIPVYVFHFSPCERREHFPSLRRLFFNWTKTEPNEDDAQRPSFTSAIMMSMNSKQPFSMHPMLHEPKYTPLHSSSEAIRRACLPTPSVSPAPRINFDTWLVIWSVAFEIRGPAAGRPECFSLF